MAAATDADFDLGPLTWVKGEIDQALAKGLAALADFAAHPEDKTPLKHAQTHIHQAAGAVQIVGLDGAITLIEEIERHLTWLEDQPPDSAAAHADAIGAACRRLSRYLQELTEGEPPITLKLYPEYETLTRLRGNDSASPTDLFYPDLTRRPPHLAAGTARAAVAERAPALLRSQRRSYQQGLLGWLRGDTQGLAAMQRAVQAIEEAHAGTPTGTFWWTVSAFLASAAEQGILPSFTVKQLCARVDLQIRRFVEGSTKVADRLRREVLYHVAISAPVSRRVQEVQALYGLPGMLPQRTEARQVELDRFQPVLKHAQDLIAGIKDHWLRFTSGRAEALAPMAQSFRELKAQAALLQEPALDSLVGALEDVASGASRAGSVPDALAMEFATGLLLAEDAIGHFARLSDDFPRQVEAMRRRLDQAQHGLAPLPSAEEDLLDNMARRAQERMLLAQVAREIQGNLRHMEKVLDAFFRDADERGELAGLGAYTRQIQGALRILGLAQADELLAMCQKQIDDYAAGAPAGTEDLELLAESLSGLGFYIEAVEQQRPDAGRLLDPLLRRRLGLGIEPLPEGTAHSIESDLEAHRQALPASLARFRAAPQDPALRAELDAHLQALKQDADLVADTAFAGQAASALAALKDEHAPTAVLLARLDELAPEPATVAPGPSAETMRLLGVGEAKLDAELGEIFLTEAGEVLATVGENLQRCASDPQDREALQAIRRGFHTLKGSGRMVGLLELGEVAYSVEKVLNRWLDEERPAAPELIAMLGDAEHEFKRWVGELQSLGAVQVDDRELMAKIAGVEAAFPPLHTQLAAPPAPQVEAADAEVDARAAPGAVVPAAPHAIVELPTEESIELEAIPEAGMVEAPLAPQTGVAAPGAERAEAEAAPATESDMMVGGVRISSSLYRILLEETAQHLATLDHELEALQFDPQANPTDAMVRAAHTLTGIHRTAGFQPVADTAHALESALLSLQHHAARPDWAVHALADGAAAVAELVDSVGMRQPFDAAALDRAEQARAKLAELRAAGDDVAADSETLAVRAALADEIAAMPLPEMLAPTTFPGMPEMAAVAEVPVVPELPVSEEAPEVTEVSLEPEAFMLRAISAAPEIPVVPEIPAVQETLDMPAALVLPETPLAPPEVWKVPAAVVPPPPRAGLLDAGAGAKPESPPALEPEAAEADLVIAEPLRARAAVLAAVRDDLDAQLLPIFLEEAQELFPHAGALLRDWRRAPQQREYAQDLRRTLHTLKGSARMAGAMRLGELTHLMESRLMAGQREVDPSPELFDALDSDLDQQAGLLDQLQSGAAATAPIPAVEHLPSPAETEPAAPAGAAAAATAHGGGRRCGRARRRNRRPATDDGARALRRDRPAGERNRRSLHSTGPYRGRTAFAEGQPAGVDQQRNPVARSGARDRDPG
ncbi:MAG: Hpt domain-containing protein [Betaproteobacteria bacterium]|nr:Hpt domain-containing protein [Betaproteobacteria bacterium]